MHRNTWWGKTLRFIGIVLMAITSGFILLGGIGTICAALFPNSWGSMAPLASYQWLYILFVLSDVRSPVPWTLILVGITAAALLLPRLALVQRYAARIFTAEGAPGGTTAIVFGAGLRRDGTPTTVLADRVSTAATLYHQGRVQSLLLSGSTRGQRYDEAEAMRTLALRLDVPEQAIQVDKEGNRTLETCQRAARAFGVHSALLVTQRFHLPRALVLCEAMGMQAFGVEADLSRYSTRSRWIPAATVPAGWWCRARSAMPRITSRG